MRRVPRSCRPWLGGAMGALLVLVWIPASAQQPAQEPPAADGETANPLRVGVNLGSLSVGDLAGMVNAVQINGAAPQEWSCLGCHESQLDAELWRTSLHRNSDEHVTCLDCHPEARETAADTSGGLVHPEEVSSQHCGDCHDGMDAIMAGAEITALGHRVGGENSCAGCHDPHSMGETLDVAEFVAAGCRECHDQGEDLAEKHSEFFCQAELHLAKVGCLHCHLAGNDIDAVHNVRFGEAANLGCDVCHGPESLLALAGPVEDDVGPLKLQNRTLARETGYLIGANRIWGLDLLIILMVVGSLGFPLFHGGLRFFFHWKSK